jgi:hypothetical protein
MPEDAREKFHGGQQHVHGQPQERGAQAAMQAVRWHAEVLTTERGKENVNWILEQVSREGREGGEGNG